MAAEEDNFDIDIYGDGGEDYQDEGNVDLEGGQRANGGEAQENSDLAALTPAAFDGSGEPQTNGHDSQQEIKGEEEVDQSNNVAHKIGSTDESTLDPLRLPKQAPQAQGLKRKEGADDRPLDPGATSALFISELHWWINDDDIRGWANQSECEDELEDMTFSEHKVNGKSKGQAYVLFKSPQAATATKHKIESFSEGQKYRQKFTVSYTNPYTNPFKTLPKDGPMRSSNQNNRAVSGGFGGSTAPTPQQSSYNPGGGYRGRGGFNNRGGVNGGYNRGGYQPPFQPAPMANNFQPAPVSGFHGPVMGGGYGGGFQNRGGMRGGMMGGAMGMHGGRGGMNHNPMMGMPMGGMNLGGLPGPMGGMGNMGMSMPQMGVGMGVQGSAGFQGAQPHYNPAFFPQHGGQGDSTWNPHGAKRTRQE